MPEEKKTQKTVEQPTPKEKRFNESYEGDEPKGKKPPRPQFDPVDDQATTQDQ